MRQKKQTGWLAKKYISNVLFLNGTALWHIQIPVTDHTLNFIKLTSIFPLEILSAYNQTFLFRKHRILWNLKFHIHTPMVMCYLKYVFVLFKHNVLTDL